MTVQCDKLRLWAQTFVPFPPSIAFESASRCCKLVTTTAMYGCVLNDVGALCDFAHMRNLVRERLDKGVSKVKL
eukprot:8380598-Pyramimonas_sp.AAC.1